MCCRRPPEEGTEDFGVVLAGVECSWKYPSASQWDGLKLGFMALLSPGESAEEACNCDFVYLQEVGGPYSL